MIVERMPPPVEGVELLTLEGELDIGTVPEAAGSIDAFAGTSSRIVLDLTGLTFFDSAGVRLVDRLARRCAGEGGCLRLVAPRGNRARRVLEMVGLSDSPVREDLGAAVADMLADGSPG